MCFIISRDEHPKIAEKDMTVYKIVEGIPSGNWFMSICKPFSYRKGEKYKTEIRETDELCWSDSKQEEDYRIQKTAYDSIELFMKANNYVFYGQGFHSCKTIERCKESEYNLTYYRIAECTIPKGSLYMLNRSDEMISNQIIINN